MVGAEYRTGDRTGKLERAAAVPDSADLFARVLLPLAEGPRRRLERLVYAHPSSWQHLPLLAVRA